MSGPLRIHGDGYDGIRGLCEAYENGPVRRSIHEAWMAHVAPHLVLDFIDMMRRYRSNWHCADQLRELAEGDLKEMLEADS